MKAVSEKKLIDEALLAYKRHKEAEKKEKKEIAAERLKTFNAELSRIFDVTLTVRKLECDIGNIKLVPEVDYSAATLCAVKACPKCKRPIKSRTVYNMRTVGALLAGDPSMWRKHTCPESEKKEKAPGDELFELLYRMLDILGVPAE